jgi:hypothetical protein
MNDPRTTAPAPEGQEQIETQNDALDQRGGDPVEGSGFETEEPDWTFEERR